MLEGGVPSRQLRYPGLQEFGQVMLGACVAIEKCVAADADEKPEWKQVGAARDLLMTLFDMVASAARSLYDVRQKNKQDAAFQEAFTRWRRRYSDATFVRMRLANDLLRENAGLPPLEWAELPAHLLELNRLAKAMLKRVSGKPPQLFSHPELTFLNQLCIKVHGMTIAYEDIMPAASAEVRSEELVEA